MNYYDVFRGQNEDYWSSALRPGQCCAVVEAALLYTNGPNKVETCVRLAVGQKRTLLFWHVLDKGKKFYRKAEEEIVCLPATTFIGEYRNKRSGKLIRSYVTNLQQEW